MKLDRSVYLGLAIVGLVLPYSQLVPVRLENGVEFGLIISEITSSRIALFGWMDLIVSAVVLVLMVLDEKNTLHNWWIPVVATFTVGVS